MNGGSQRLSADWGRDASQGRGAGQERGAGRGRGASGGRGTGRVRGAGRGRGTGWGQGAGRGRDNRLDSGHRQRQQHGIPTCAVSISVPDDNFTQPNMFQPLRDPGPHFPPGFPLEPTELDLFCLFVDDEVLDRLATSTTQYAEQKKGTKPTMHTKFKRHPLTADEIMRFLGCLLLLSINTVRNYRQAWNDKSSQRLVHLNHLLTRDRFEQIASFLHVVTAEEEAELSQHRHFKSM